MARRRRNRSGQPEDEDGISVAELAARHLLLVPSTVHPAEVGSLLRDRIPDSDLAGTGEVLFGRTGRLSGPYELSMEDAVDAAVPMPWTIVYCLEAPVEREAPPLPGVDDRDGFAYAFPEGLPWRDEGRALHLLVSLARRVHGAVRTAGSLQVIMPDPDRAVDYVVHSPEPLDPQVLLGIIRRDLPGAYMATQPGNWEGPPEAVYTGELVAADIRHDPLSAQDIHDLHAHADVVDFHMLGETPVLDAFAIVGDLGPDGVIEVQVHLGDPAEPAVAGEPWARGDFLTYELRWVSPDPRDREQRYPSQEFLAARGRVKPLVAAVTRSVVEAVHGVVLDEDGFRVDRYAL